MRLRENIPDPTDTPQALMDREIAYLDSVSDYSEYLRESARDQQYNSYRSISVSRQRSNSDEFFAVCVVLLLLCTILLAIYMS